jgi:hypothetical protein
MTQFDERTKEAMDKFQPIHESTIRRLQLLILDMQQELKEREWRDATKELPEKSGYYLVRIKHEDSYLTYSPDNWCFVQMFKYGRFEGFDSKVTVLHWMPLTKPPAAITTLKGE